MSIPRQVRLCSRFFRVCVFGCLVALAAACPYRASANDLTICKTTVPPTGTSGPFFAFTGANGFPTGQKSFNSLYLSNQSIFKLQDSTSNPANCQIFNITGNDQLNKITETVPPPPWKLTNISCTSGKSVVTIFGSNANPAFQPGDNTVSVDQADPNVTCTFVNTCAGTRLDLSTGVGSWIVTRPNGVSSTPHKVAPNSNWASQSPPPSGGSFPAGTSWVQPANSSTLTSEPAGDYVYQIRFVVKCPAKVQGWFAADNGGILVLDANPATTVQCNLPTCFLQNNVTSFGPWSVGIGTHVIKVTVTNQGSLTGLLAHILVQ